MTPGSLIALWLRLFPVVATSPFFSAYGVYVVVRAVVRAVDRVRRSGHVLDAALRCPHGHEVPVVGRFACAGCHSEYLGWIGRCDVCGEGADFTRCPTCRVGVRLPWEEP